MRKVHIADIFAGFVFSWIGILIILNFIIPTSWYFQYDRLETEDVCSGDIHQVTGYYWAGFKISAEGIDHVVNDRGIRKDRFEWNKGTYQKGTQEGTWNHHADLLPGEYTIQSTELVLNILRVFPVYLNEDERPVSNEFKVISCES